MELSKILGEAKKKNQVCILEMIKTFKPLINKYGRKLDYDGDSEITIFILKIIYQMPCFDSDDKIVSYINRSVKNYCFHLLKSIKTEYPAEDELFENISFENNKYHDVEMFSLIKCLPDFQRKVIIWVYYIGYSEVYIAEKLGISRQAVNNAKKRALNKLRTYLSN